MLKNYEKYKDKIEIINVWIWSHGPKRKEVLEPDPRPNWAYEGAKEQGFPFPVLIDTQDQTANRRYGSPPGRAVLVDVDGRIAWLSVIKSPKLEPCLEAMDAVIANNGRTTAKPPELGPDEPESWAVVKSSSKVAFVKLVEHYREHKRWTALLELLQDHRHHQTDPEVNILTHDCLRAMREADVPAKEILQFMKYIFNLPKYLPKKNLEVRKAESPAK